jgi:hypothetical protein
VEGTLHRRSGLLPGPLRTLAGHAAFTNHIVLDEWLRLTPGLHKVSTHIAQSGGKAISSEFTVLVLILLKNPSVGFSRRTHG